MQKIVLDASALLAWYLDEPGVDVVDAMLHPQTCYLSTVNLSEFVSIGADRNAPQSEIKCWIDDLHLTVINFDKEQSILSGMLRNKTRHLGLSLGDRACLAAAQSLQAVAVTADRIWCQLDLDIDIQCIR